LALSYTSAAAEARIGGDLYEVVATPHGVRLLIGDVQGKGLDAVETAAWVLGAFREAAYDEPELDDVSERLESSRARHLSGEKFVTAIIAEVRDMEVVLLNHGHPSPFLISANGYACPVEPPDEAFPLGLGLFGATRPKTHRVPFRGGDQILLFTDGVVEARDDSGPSIPCPAVSISSRRANHRRRRTPCVPISSATPTDHCWMTRRCCCCAGTSNEQGRSR
jgi:serine phosphatase RsbU (regulator of sigma subunit)